MGTRRAARYAVETLAARHDRASFSCGRPELDRHLRDQARQDARRGVTVPYVAAEPGRALVAGYFTLSAFGVALRDLPDEVAGRLPRYPLVPATLLGRLAVDTRHQGHGLGELLLLEALSRSLAASSRIASAAVVVDAFDDSAHRFYRHFEFIPFRDDARRLFLPMRAIASLLAG